LQQNEKERLADVPLFVRPKLAEDRSYFFFTNKHPFLLGCSQRNVENSPPYVYRKLPATRLQIYSIHCPLETPKKTYELR
jgi:hypothetical protein